MALFIFNIICLTFLFKIYADKHVTNHNLVAVVQIFKHGQRTPIKCYPKDPFLNFWNILGYGQLTQEGAAQQRALGEFTRQLYQGWLPEQYDEHDLTVWTTNRTRTFLSAKYNIDKLYPKNDVNEVVPISLEDPSILNNLIPLSCSSYYVETANYLTRDESLAIDKHFNKTYTHLTVNSEENITNYMEAYLLCDCLDIENTVGLPLAQWTRSLFPDPIKQLQALYIDALSHTIKQQRFAMGPWFKEVLEYLEKMASDPSSSQKFRMYGVHDFNLMVILNVLEAYREPFYLPVASSIYFELRKKKEYNYVTVWLKFNDELRQIRIKDCDLDCPLEDIRKLLKDVIVDVPTRDTECVESAEFERESAKIMYDKLNKIFSKMPYI